MASAYAMHLSCEIIRCTSRASSTHHLVCAWKFTRPHVVVLGNEHFRDSLGADAATAMLGVGRCLVERLVLTCLKLFWPWCCSVAP